MSLKVKKYSLLITLFAITTFVYAQKAVLDTNRITVGDQIQFELLIDLKKGNDIAFPVFENTIIDGIDIVKNKGIDTIRSGKTLRQSYIITSFEDSIFNILPIPILVGKDTFLTNPLTLAVYLFVPDSVFMTEIDTSQVLDIADLKEQENLHYTFAEFWYDWGLLIMIFSSFAMLSFAGYYVYKRYKENKPIFMPYRATPPHETAFKQLEKLKEKSLDRKGLIKEYYTELTDILRIYIENVYNIPAPEYISSQIISALSKTHSIEKEAVDKISRILQTADDVKFAKFVPTEFDNDLSMKDAFAFVEMTKPQEIEEEQENEVIKEEKDLSEI